MRLFLIPTEPLLFRRTGRSFSAGESGYADTLFPPTPETLQGAIRAAIATHWDSEKTTAQVFEDKDFTNLIGLRTDYARFRITGIALGRRKKDEQAVQRLFPAPAFLQEKQDVVGHQKQDRIVYLRPQPLNGVYTNIPESMSQEATQFLYYEMKEKLNPLDWITEEGLRKALQPDIQIDEEKDIVKNKDIFTYESRLGIGMNNDTKTTREGFLYQMRMIRMNGGESDYLYGFVVDVHLAKASETNAPVSYPEQLEDDETFKELLHLPESGWITLGGERRAARFEVIPTSSEGQSGGLDQARRRNFIYLATPATFKGGWMPENWKPEHWQKPLPVPVAAAIDRYRSIGGWLLAPGSSGGNDKPIRRCVPAGSVYFFNQAVTIEGPFTDYGWQIGYGIAYAGEW